MEIPVRNTENMTLDPAALGLKGSPTRVVKIDTPKVTRGGRVVTATDEASIEGAVDELFAFLRAKELV